MGGRNGREAGKAPGGRALVDVEEVARCAVFVACRLRERAGVADWWRPRGAARWREIARAAGVEPVPLPGEFPPKAALVRGRWLYYLPAGRTDAEEARLLATGVAWVLTWQARARLPVPGEGRVARSTAPTALFLRAAAQRFVGGAFGDVLPRFCADLRAAPPAPDVRALVLSEIAPEPTRSEPAPERGRGAPVAARCQAGAREGRAPDEHSSGEHRAGEHGGKWEERMRGGDAPDPSGRDPGDSGPCPDPAVVRAAVERMFEGWPGDWQAQVDRLLQMPDGERARYVEALRALMEMPLSQIEAVRSQLAAIETQTRAVLAQNRTMEQQIVLMREQLRALRGEPLPSVERGADTGERRDAPPR